MKPPLFVFFEIVFYRKTAWRKLVHFIHSALFRTMSFLIPIRGGELGSGQKNIVRLIAPIRRDGGSEDGISPRLPLMRELSDARNERMTEGEKTVEQALF